MRSTRPAVPARAVAFGAAGMLCVGTSVSVSAALTDAPLFTAQAIRYAAAFLLLLALARLSGASVPRPRGGEWLWLAGVAVSGLVVFNVAIVRGVAHAEPAVIAVAVACVPVLLALSGPLIEHRRPTAASLVAAAVVTAGGVLVVGTGRTDVIGVGWAAVALACEAGFTLLAMPVLRRLGPWGVSVHAVWMAAALLAALALTVDGPSAASRLTASQWLAMLHLAVVVTALAFLLWYSAVDALGAGPAGLLTGIAPVSAAVAGTLLGHGVPSAGVWLGIAVVLVGLVAGLVMRGVEDSLPADVPPGVMPTATPTAIRRTGAATRKPGRRRGEIHARLNRPPTEL